MPNRAERFAAENTETTRKKYNKCYISTLVQREGDHCSPSSNICKRKENLSVYQHKNTLWKLSAMVGGLGSPKFPSRPCQLVSSSCCSSEDLRQILTRSDKSSSGQVSPDHRNLGCPLFSLQNRPGTDLFLSACFVHVCLVLQSDRTKKSESTSQSSKNILLCTILFFFNEEIIFSPSIFK